MPIRVVSGGAAVFLQSSVRRFPILGAVLRSGRSPSGVTSALARRRGHGSVPRVAPRIVRLRAAGRTFGRGTIILPIRGPVLSGSPLIWCILGGRRLLLR